MAALFAQTCERYFALCRETGPGLLSRLAVLLADLHAQVLRLPEGGVGEDTEVAGPEYQSVYAHIGAAFPELGFYHHCLNPLSVCEEPHTGTGDAIDDLADIYCDLHEGWSLWNKGYVAEAVWQWRFGFQQHWGAHLVAVQTVVYEQMHP